MGKTMLPIKSARLALLAFITAFIVTACGAEPEGKAMIWTPDENIGINQSANKGQRSFSGSLLMSDTDKIISAQAEFDEEEMHTVQLSIDPVLQNDPMGVQSMADAIITWFAGGNSIVRRITVANGISISGMSKSVQVAISNRNVISGPTVPTQPFRVYGLIGKGIRAANAQPPILIPADSGGWYQGAQLVNAAAGSTSIKIPTYPSNIVGGQGVGVISAFVQLSNAAGIAIPSNGVLMYQQRAGVNVAVCDPRGGWIPISPAADRIAFYNFTANAVLINVVWGIDG